MKLSRICVSAAIGVALCAAGLVSPVRAFDLFNLFGASETRPTPSSDAIPYVVEFSGLDGTKNLEGPLKEASNAWRLRQEAPSSGVGLSRRLVSDFPRLNDALRASGYFDATIRVRVAGVAIEPDGTGADAAAEAAEKLRNREVAPVRVEIDPGPLFVLRHLAVYDARTRAPIDSTLFSKRAFEVTPDDPARAATLRALQTQWIDELRGKSYPLARIASADATVDHNAHVMDAKVVVDPGPRAGIGAVELRGSPGIDPAVIRSFMYLEEGEDYSPQKLADARKSISRIEAVGAVRVEDGEKLDANGNLPVVIETTERKQHALGAAAQYSNIDGPSLRAYWVARNLFGGAERLRIDLLAGLAPFSGGAKFGGFSSLKFSDIIGGARVSFLKPALWGTRNDLLIDPSIIREKTNYYQAEYANLTTQVRHRFSDQSSVQGGVLVERGHWDDTFGGHDYSLLGFPLSASYDSTDNQLAPTKGVRAIAGVTPYVNALPNAVTMVQAKEQVSAYQAVDEDSKYIIAGRVAGGAIFGPEISSIPASQRFFAGGGGSVRGFAYRSLSPRDTNGNYVGGRSLFESSLEARVKLTDTIGFVPFVDAGQANSSSLPDFKSPMRIGVGLGLRYYTGIGPLRLDVATPLNPLPGGARFALFIGIGESF